MFEQVFEKVFNQVFKKCLNICSNSSLYLVQTTVIPKKAQKGLNSTYLKNGLSNIFMDSDLCLNYLIDTGVVKESLICDICNFGSYEFSFNTNNQYR
jgi:hypothetical protein